MQIVLRKITCDDLEQIRKWRMQPEVTKYMYTDPVITSEQQAKWYEKIKKDPSVKYWIINVNSIDIGVLNLTNIDYQNSHCSWGYYIADDRFKGKGLAKIIEVNVYEYVFYLLKMNKLWCEVLEFNSKVVSLHQKFGSEIEGTLREHVFKNGKYFDVIRMSITKRKWETIRNQFITNYSNIEIED